MPYVLWNAAFNTLFLLGFAILTEWNRRHCYAPRAPRLFDQINTRSLRVFLMANLLTGLINLFIPTMHSSSFVSMCILAVYSLLALIVVPQISVHGPS
ncbi:Glucosaminyl phosphatidylinositol (GlcN-PI) nositol acylation protein [Malassezia yamatoensis]|uniref:GPI-anchored wall transfer protein 1 n=1 Tax=Malassezia yamatoensis TaxID=253288 RepID=A0AAJ5Z1V6_9BASI|nr:Glucosaminyl phosphatidylinositol (GlcN-PI) nositol acylation protein [Malassezia yamatoensis]